MSFPPTPPPLPPQQPPPPPIPVQPLSYGPPTYARRPGILTAVAVLSIVLGSLGVLGSGATALYGMLMSLASGLSRTATYSATVSSSTVVTPPRAAPAHAGAFRNQMGTDGMPPADRLRVIAALARLHDLSGVRRAHLDALLAKAGKKILPLSGGALTQQTIQANVTDDGRYPAGDGSPAGGADYFAVARGRVEVDDRHAVFYPAGGGDVVRAAAATDTTGEDEVAAANSSAAPATGPAAAAGAVGVPLTDAQVQQVIAAIESRTGNKLTSAQARTLRARLKSSAQTLFTPASPVATQIVGTVWYNGAVSFTTRTGSLTLLRQGGVSTTGGITPGIPSFRNVLTQIILVFASAGLSLALAILLLIAGIRTTRDSPGARRLHLIYAYAKIPVGIFTVLAWGWFWFAFMGGLPTASGSTPALIVTAIFSAPVLLGLIYPVALLIIMHTRTVKAYYSPAVSD